jgi:hypothetical protein
MSRHKPFEAFNAGLSSYTPAFRCKVEAHCDSTQGDGRLLALDCRDRVERELCPDPILDYVPRRTRRTPHHGTPTSTSTGSGRVELEHNDPLKSIPAKLYLPAVAGVEVSSTGRCRCPMPDHRDEHPSAKAYGARWKCFSCGAEGTIIDLGAALYDLEPTGRGYHEIRSHLLADLGLARESR